MPLCCDIKQFLDSISLYQQLGCICAVDYGTKRTGIAMSDDGMLMAFPFDIIHLNGNFTERLNILSTYIQDLIAQKKLSGIVFGNPLTSSGDTVHEKLLQEIDALIQIIISNYQDLPIIKIDERMTSIAADKKLRSAIYNNVVPVYSAISRKKNINSSKRDYRNFKSSQKMLHNIIKDGNDAHAAMEILNYTLLQIQTVKNISANP